MKRSIWFILLVFLYVGSSAQQFRISEFDGENLTLEYPPSFDGAYLFVDRKSNLVDGVWETVDYDQVTLEEGEPVFYSPPVDDSDPAAANQSEIPYLITPEYMEAVQSGEIEDQAWIAAGSIFNPVVGGAKAFFRIVSFSFVDSDGDGVDNVTEYGRGTDPYTSDAPPVTLPDDDGDPQTVPGSVDSTPGDWNTSPSNDYHAVTGYPGAVNKLILALEGTNGTFSATNTITQLGAWIEGSLGTWLAPDPDETYPTTENGRFYRTETNGFAWAGKENIYGITFQPYTGAEPVEFTNHLVQATTNDPPGLAVLPGGAPVLVDGSSPWTAEKLAACLKVLITVPCRVQKTIGSGETATHDASDTTHMAQAMFQHYTQTPYPTNRVAYPYNEFYLHFSYQYPDWDIFNIRGKTGNETFTFSDNLSAHGFGPTVHRGYVGVIPPYDWKIDTFWLKRSLLSTMPTNVTSGIISKTFTASAGESAWFMAGSSNYCEGAEHALYDYPPSTPPLIAFHWKGFECYAAEVLSTLSPPPIAEEATLVMDSDRDGNIGTNDFDRVDESHPFRFWVNEDSNTATYAEANLEDFFPAQISWPEGGSAPNLTFKLSANIGLDYIVTSMTTNDTDAYLTDLTVAGTLAGNISSLSSGTQTTEVFNENEIVLLAADTADTNAQIHVHILQNGSEIAVSTNHFSFTPVADMYRTKNLRAGGIDSPEASNWPDELTNGKDFVFIHGYNVDEAAGREWNAAIFKRLWHSSSYAKYHAVLWDGSPEETTWLDFGPYHYHNAVIHAFATAPSLATYLDSLNEPVVAAHSLGNMVANEAITGDHGLPAYKVKQLYALDAAVALEAYGDSATSNSSAMVSDNLFDRMDAGLFSDLIPIIPDFNEYEWEDYPYTAWSSEWYKLFTNNVNDARGKLTWRHRFLNIQDKTDVFNFYSSSEEVLRIDEGNLYFINATFGKYAWQVQEHFKGRLNSSWITGIFDSIGGAASEYCGWGFIDQEPTDHIHGIGVFQFAPRRPRRLHEQLANENPDQQANLQKLATDPLFHHKPEELFQAGAAAFAGGTVSSHGGTLDYNTSNDTYPIGNVPMRDWLIAKAFPSRTRPMGSSNNSKWDEDVNVDMHVECENFTSGLPSKNGTEWHHNAVREAPYLYVHRLFDRITGKEN